MNLKVKKSITKLLPIKGITFLMEIIYSDYKNNKKATYQDMAEKYGTSKSNVAHIVLGIDWKYLNLKPIYKRDKYNKQKS